MKRLFLSCLSMVILLTFSCDSPTKSDNGDPDDYWQKTSLSVSNILSWGIGSGNDVFIGTTSEYGSIFRSTNNGETWESVNNNGLGEKTVRFLAFNPDANYLFAGSGYVSYSTDNGESWTLVASFDPVSFFSVSTLVTYGYNILAGGEKGIIGGSISDPPTGWGYSMRSVPTYSLAYYPEGNCVLAGTNDGIFQINVQSGIGIWDHLGLAGESITSLVIDSQGQVFAATENDVFRSSNGSNWQATGFNKTATCLAINDNGDAFAGTMYEGIFCLSNNGEWEETNTGFMDDDGSLVRYVQCLGIDSEGYLYAGTAANGLFRSVKTE